MAKKIYVGVSDKAREVKKIYVGVDGVARKVKKAYIGDSDGKARQVYAAALEYTYSGTSSFSGDPEGDWVLTCTGDGTLVFKSLPTNIDIHLVGGGGGGASGSYAHGGGGGYTKTLKNYAPTQSTFYCDIGAGGAKGANGSASYFRLSSSSGTIVAQANGGKGATAGSGNTGGAGGSGGGYWGQKGGSDGSNGGGSKGGAGQGTTTRDFGETSGTLRAGGGSGQDITTGGSGGGGAGGAATSTGTGKAGTANYGGGGGGGISSGAAGGSGIIIIRNAR